MRILLVEDERKISTYVKRGLEESGYAVDPAYTGQEALDWAESAPYDLIILDILLPEMDGLLVCRELRRRGNRTPVLMLTARDDIDDRVAGLDAGADDYLVKPFALKELLARMRALTPEGFPLRKWLMGILVCIWGVRLSLYIFWRNWGKPEDFRYQAWRKEAGSNWWWQSLFRVFLLQGILMWIISTPLLSAQHSAMPAHLVLLDILGVVVWAIGFFFESVGDFQLALLQMERGFSYYSIFRCLK